MRYCEMTDRERCIVSFVDFIISSENELDSDYNTYAQKMISLDEVEVAALGGILGIPRRENITLKDLFASGYTDKQKEDVFHFLDHPESRLKNFVRYER